MERHGQLNQHPVLPDGGALLSEAKLQSIMSFLDEMEKSEQERPRSVTSGSHREVGFFLSDLLITRDQSEVHAWFSFNRFALWWSVHCLGHFSIPFMFGSVELMSCCRPQAVLSEEELVGVDHLSATAAEVSSSMMRIKLELEEKKRTVNMLQAALVGKMTVHNTMI